MYHLEIMFSFKCQRLTQRLNEKVDHAKKWATDERSRGKMECNWANPFVLRDLRGTKVGKVSLSRRHRGRWSYYYHFLADGGRLRLGWSVLDVPYPDVSHLGSINQPTPNGVFPFSGLSYCSPCTVHDTNRTTNELLENGMLFRRANPSGESFRAVAFCLKYAAGTRLAA